MFFDLGKVVSTPMDHPKGIFCPQGVDTSYREPRAPRKMTQPGIQAEQALLRKLSDLGIFEKRIDENAKPP